MRGFGAVQDSSGPRQKCGWYARQKVVRRRLVDGVVAVDVVDREADRDGLHVQRLRDSSGALGSPVSARDSKPVTYSVPVSGSSSPVSVASST